MCLILCMSITYVLNKTVFFIIVPTVVMLLGFFYNKITNLNLKFSGIIYSPDFSQYKGVIKVSAVVHENESEVLNYFNNYNTYKGWNKYLIGIVDVKKDSPLGVTYRYFRTFIESDGDIELKVIRKKHLNTIVDFIDGEILRVITFESNKARTKITIYLTLSNLNNRIPITLVKSTVKSLDLLSLYITNGNFNKDIIPKERRYTDITESEDYSICTVETRQKSKGVYRKSNTLGMISELKLSNTDIQTIPEEIQKDNKDIRPFEAKPVDPFESENQEIRKLIDEKRKEFYEYYNRPWKVMEEKNGYKLFYFDEKTGLRSIRAEVTINKPIKEIYDYLQIFEKKGQYDKNFDNGKLLRKIDENYSIDYLKYKGKLMISPRDFTIVSYKEINNDEAFIFAINYISEKYPKIKGIERADLIFGYFHLKRLEDSKTYFTFYTLVYEL
jgi:hypothetical protein